MSENKKSLDKAELISAKSLRRLLGTLAFLMPFILMLIAVIIGDCEWIQNSISGYYHTCARNFFVGAICSIAFCLFAYYGYDERDNLLANLAGFCALGVAFFPTNISPPYTNCLTKAMSEELNNDIISYLHYGSAAGVFILLGIFSAFIFTKTNPNKEMSSGKKKRNTVYKICGYAIFAFIILIPISANIDGIDNYRPVFWLETFALIAFSVSWLVKGEIVFGD